jgi:hypothetical protein
MPRTNESDVRAIFDTDLDSTSLTAWIEIASEYVDDIAAADSSLSSTRLETLEKLITAHFASSQDQRIQRADRNSASVTYQGETGEGFSGTKYGQQALALDPTGTLANSQKPKASISVPDVKGISD